MYFVVPKLESGFVLLRIQFFYCCFGELALGSVYVSIFSKDSIVFSKILLSFQRLYYLLKDYIIF
jgi:hypothetical protein